jgi:hypothetical protein
MRDFGKVRDSELLARLMKIVPKPQIDEMDLQRACVLSSEVVSVVLSRQREAGSAQMAGR